LLFASTGTKDPKASDVLYIGALAAPNTINTMPEKTLISFAEHGKLSDTLPRNGGDCEDILSDFRKAGIDLDKLGEDLQSQGAKSFDDSWQNLLSAIEAKGKSLQSVA
jgi:transaldolase